MLNHVLAFANSCSVVELSSQACALKYVVTLITRKIGWKSSRSC